jgi:hypothetical protein
LQLATAAVSIAAAVLAFSMTFQSSAAVESALNALCAAYCGVSAALLAISLLAVGGDLSRRVRNRG